MGGADNRRTVMLVSNLSSFLTPFAASSFNIALPTIGREFSLDAISLSWAALAYLLASAMFLVPFGKLADIYGRKRIFIYGTSIFTVASFLLSVYPSSATLIPFRALQGIGAAMIFGTSVAILVSAFSPGERGAVLGVNAASVYVGLSIGPFFGGLLTEVLGWRSIFHVNVAIGLTIVGFTALRLRDERTEAAGERFDIRGSTLYSVMLLALMYGFSLLPSMDSMLPLMIGVTGALAFFRLELRTEHPVLNVNLFLRNRAFTFSNAAALINYSATYAVTFLLSLYLQYLKGLSPEEAGLIMVSSPVVQAVFSPVSGRLSDRIEPRKVASVGMAITALGLLPFVFMDGSTPELFVTASLGLLGFGLAIFSSPNNNAIMSSVERTHYGVASATLGTMRLTGQMLSMGISMMIFALYIGRAEITESTFPLLLASIRVAFIVFTILCVVGVFSSLIRNRVSWTPSGAAPTYDPEIT